MLVLLVLFSTIEKAQAIFEIPGCVDNSDGEFTSEGEFDFVPELGVGSIIVGMVIMIGTVLSVFPQYIKLLRKRDSSGLSPFYLLIQFINQVTAVANGCITNATYIHSCVYLGFNGCFGVLISWIQIMLLAMVYLPQIVFYLVFFPDKKNFSLFKIPLYTTPVVVFISLLIFGTVPLLEMTDGECGEWTSGIGFLYGIICTICVFIQWSPQIYMTFKRKSAGALSVLMMSITAPGMVILTIYMIFITKQSFSTWLSNAASAIQQVILLTLLIYYEFIKKRFCPKKDEESEIKPLLGDKTTQESESDSQCEKVPDVLGEAIPPLDDGEKVSDRKIEDTEQIITPLN
ncbi:hypothetical protein EIN_053770 [Entamoeba invadens IP1]|uniref:PQ loop repeat-containing protein n=1 Tax=Entamoeba invadens TaxID=33085 RepID=S0B5D0_ENTIV|nr:hypothetical protein EIN_053770 [Entamoeba invadens IP1]ELP93122.1 hypothetical protein EIN_053770 [Entamoeba invadens IP1]BAN41057.1 hypothetical protein, conserved [Entamoeba invadens]|eukprot:XP_004259893.1 hypothetical protein EIN_053770 [Entamoeba invadens IP1]